MCAVQRDSWKAFLLTIDTVFFSLEILWGWHWYWVPGKNKTMSITRFDSLDRDRLDFLGLERLGTQMKSQIFVSPWGMVMFNHPFNICCTIFGIRINQSFMVMRIKPATEKAMFPWKVTKADSKRKLQKQISSRGYALLNVICKMVQNFWCDLRPCDECFLCRSTASHVDKVVNLFCKRMFYAIE